MKLSVSEVITKYYSEDEYPQAPQLELGRIIKAEKDPAIRWTAHPYQMGDGRISVNFVKRTDTKKEDS